VSNPISRSQNGRDAVLLLTILLQHRKYDSENPYVVKLSILDDELALTGLAMVMSSVFAQFNRYFNYKISNQSEFNFDTILNSEYTTMPAAVKKVNHPGGIV
jgi:hypothetical protein